MNERVLTNPPTVSGKISRRHLRGQAGDGGPLLEVDSGSGGMRVE